VAARRAAAAAGLRQCKAPAPAAGPQLKQAAIKARAHQLEPPAWLFCSVLKRPRLEPGLLTYYSGSFKGGWPRPGRDQGRASGPAGRGARRRMLPRRGAPAAAGRRAQARACPGAAAGLKMFGRPWVLGRRAPLAGARVAPKKESSPAPRARGARGGARQAGRSGEGQARGAGAAAAAAAAPDAGALARAQAPCAAHAVLRVSWAWVTGAAAWGRGLFLSCLSVRGTWPGVRWGVFGRLREGCGAKLQGTQAREEVRKEKAGSLCSCARAVKGPGGSRGAGAGARLRGACTEGAH
jgi:hypothetical protein